jgi:hypothetical protein
MPYLEPHGSGWRVCWREGGRGSPIRKSATFPTKVLAAAELGARSAVQAAHRKPRSLVIPWSEVRARWLLHLKEFGRTESYREQARLALEQHTGSWATTTDATPTTMGALRIGPWRIAKACLRWARTYLAQGVDYAAIARHPRRQVSRPVPDLLADAEVRRLVAKARKLGGASGELLAHMVATYGHRPQSLVHLRIESVDLRRGRITLPVKSGDTIRHPILPTTAALLKKVIGRRKDGPVLLSPTGAPWLNGQRASSWFWHFVGEGVGIYQLKSYAISRMLAGGLDLATAASITGHRTPTVLLRYARVNETRQRKALKVLGGATPVLPT